VTLALGSPAAELASSATAPQRRRAQSRPVGCGTHVPSGYADSRTPFCPERIQRRMAAGVYGSRRPNRSAASRPTSSGARSGASSSPRSRSPASPSTGISVPRGVVPHPRRLRVFPYWSSSAAREEVSLPVIYRLEPLFAPHLGRGLLDRLYCGGESLRVGQIHTGRTARLHWRSFRQSLLRPPVPISAPPLSTHLLERAVHSQPSSRLS
jgi:hypothetical protein